MSEFDIELPSNPSEALKEIAAYLRTVNRSAPFAVKYPCGELIGYTQTPAWIQGLLDIAKQCKIIEKKSRAPVEHHPV